jgi:hypothetical protein
MQKVVGSNPIIRSLLLLNKPRLGGVFVAEVGNGMA